MEGRRRRDASNPLVNMLAAQEAVNSRVRRCPACSTLRSPPGRPFDSGFFAQCQSKRFILQLALAILLIYLAAQGVFLYYLPAHHHALKGTWRPPTPPPLVVVSPDQPHFRASVVYQPPPASVATANPPASDGVSTLSATTATTTPAPTAAPTTATLPSPPMDLSAFANVPLRGQDPDVPTHAAAAATERPAPVIMRFNYVPTVLEAVDVVFTWYVIRWA